VRGPFLDIPFAQPLFDIPVAQTRVVYYSVLIALQGGQTALEIQIRSELTLQDGQTALQIQIRSKLALNAVLRERDIGKRVRKRNYVLK
jgi:hypothetical protein